MRALAGRVTVGAAGVLISVVVLGCRAGKANNQEVQAAADSLAQQHDSAMRQMDSGRSPVVDTTKLGAAKTESILTVQRKKK